MIIDIHNHPDWQGYDLERQLQNMDQFHIARAWMLSWECPKSEYDPAFYNRCTPPGNGDGPIPFARCLSYVERAPERFVLGYAPDPRRPDAIDRMEAAVSIYGAKIYGELKLRMMLDNPDALRMYRYCGEMGLPVVVHIDYEFDTGNAYPRPSYWYGGGIEAFERAVRACPETLFLGHGPGFWAHISKDDQYDRVVYPEGPIVPGGKLIEMLDSYPNLFCDLSASSARKAMARDPGFAFDFLCQYQSRMLYGRDCFDNELQDFLSTLELSEQVLNKIYCENALNIAPP